MKTTKTGGTAGPMAFSALAGQHTGAAIAGGREADAARRTARRELPAGGAGKGGEDPVEARQRKADNRRVVVGVGVGNALEWYDWTAYSLFAAYFAKQFFRSEDPISDLLGTLAIFAAGFFMRPLGGIFFGWFADRRGRRPAMTLAMLVTAAGSMVIGVAPTYDSIGPVAAVFLLLGRLLQGFGHGGEVVSSFTYVTEMAPARRRGLWASSVFAFVTVGVLSAALLSAGLTSAFGADGVREWAWRVPFVIGGVLGVYALYLRRRLDETPMFQAKAAAQAAGQAGARSAGAARRFWADVWRYRYACLRVFALSASGTVLYYVWVVMAPTFAIGSLKMAPGPVMWVSVAANVFFVFCLLAWGMLSDRYGRKLNWYFFSIGSIIAIIPLSMLLTGGNELWRLIIFMGVGTLLISAPTAIMPAFFPEQFPTHIRAVAMGLPFSIAGALTGGTAPYLQAWLYSMHQQFLFDVYLIVLCVMALVATIVSPETRGKEL
ncbi:MFS transporter [Kerstersia gyiorum]|jgi:MHS family alpha-ketoglutarate permease-like MFS transporter|uniref:MFS transporter n=1 Tax=Kerstersia gyiorum TaxID=206506 RepID=UPI00242D05DE|nr:MFS transporter [Kerstersia gyiorum]MCH4272255.1 MFS transporter [Kerstersia gyiorum]MCI1228801.1 MFS transporter [Kerstersia gyiorum]